MRKKKRKYDRIAPKKKAFASIGNTFSGICKIEDISMGGVGIGCISDIAPNKFDSEVTLYLPKDDIELSALPCRIIYQKAESLPSPKAKGEALFKRFRCGIAFEELDKSQCDMLSRFFEAIAL
jgi:PilZ domain-containing protein